MAVSPAVLQGAHNPALWGRALAGRRFRSVLLALSGVPICLAYLWFGLLKPLLVDDPLRNDFVLTYLAGGRMLAHGQDPYLCNVGLCGGYPHYLLFYPPLAFWLAQPLVGLDTAVVAGIALVLTNVMLIAFVWIVLRALDVRDWQVSFVALLATISFAPTLTEVQNRNLQVAVLMLSGIVLAAWLRGDRWWGGAALGVGLAIKLVQAPLLLLAAWGRRFGFAAAAVAAWAVLWLVASPRYLPEYLFKVAPSQAQGSAEVIDVAPFGTLNRLFHPESLYNSGLGGGPLVLVLAAAFAVAVVVITAMRLGAPRRDRDGRALEMAAAVATTPLLVTLVYAGQFILLVLPMIVLLDFGLRSQSRSTVLAVAASWLLLGPSFLAFTNAMAAGFGSPLLFQVWSNTAVAGAIVLWLASLHALRLHQQAAIVGRGDAVRTGATS